jgi:PucR family transcriptional regulator, purine catabolism regulatory protein
MAYEQAHKAVSVGRQMAGPSALTHFDGLGIFRLLTLVPDSDGAAQLCGRDAR